MSPCSHLWLKFSVDENELIPEKEEEEETQKSLQPRVLVAVEQMTRILLHLKPANFLFEGRGNLMEFSKAQEVDTQKML